MLRLESEAAIRSPGAEEKMEKMQYNRNVSGRSSGVGRCSK
jgi:hypothetical protein